MDKNGNILINKFQAGIGESSYTGFGRMQNLEIFQVPGVGKIKNRPALYFTPDAMPMAMVKDAYGNLWTGTANGKIYQNQNQAVCNVSGSSSTAVQVSGCVYDMKIANDYLLITHTGGSTVSISLIGPLNPAKAIYYWGLWKSSSAITMAWGMPLAVLTGNQYIYFGAGNSVGTLNSFTPNADPSIAPTATFSTTAIPLQSGDYVQSMTVLGRTLLIGTQGGSYFNSVAATGTANIYPYDLGTLTLGVPMPLEENGVNQMFTVNQQCFLHAGVYGNVYITNGTSIKFYKRINFNRTYGSTIFPYPNAIQYINNELFIGTSNYNGSYDSNAVQGVYSVRNNALNFKTISTYNVGQTQTLQIGCILPAGQDITYVGWQDGSTYGVDYNDYVLTGGFNAFFESEVEVVADPQNNATYDDIIVFLANPLIDGQQIQLKWRDGRSDSWTLITANNGDSYLSTASTPAGATAIYTKSKINNANTVQVQCALKQLDTVAAGNNIEILGIKVIKHTNG